jgi:hypothetical protein
MYTLLDLARQFGLCHPPRIEWRNQAVSLEVIREVMPVSSNEFSISIVEGVQSLISSVAEGNVCGLLNKGYESFLDSSLKMVARPGR